MCAIESLLSLPALPAEFSSKANESQLVSISLVKRSSRLQSLKFSLRLLQPNSAEHFCSLCQLNAACIMQWQPIAASELTDSLAVSV